MNTRSFIQNSNLIREYFTVSLQRGKSDNVLDMIITGRARGKKSCSFLIWDQVWEQTLWEIINMTIIPMFYEQVTQLVLKRLCEDGGAARALL